LNQTNLLSAPADPAAASRKWNILVVDDEDPVRELIAYVLESHGYTIFRARHSREALFLSTGFPGAFDLLVTDICMHPHADGFELARAMLRVRPDLRVIYSSGFVEPERLKREVEASRALFLPKPFTPMALLECVQRTLAVPGLAVAENASRD
jgi:two-component system, cell cycle sensor histidine kinase and response regulator CckA